MEEAVQTISVDLDKSRQSPETPIVGRVGETGRFIHVYVIKGGKPCNIKGCTLFFKGINAKGEYTDGKGTILRANDGLFEYNFGSDNFSVDGIFNLAYFEIQDENKKTITTVNFVLRVVENADLTVSQSDYYISTYEIIKQNFLSFQELAEAQWEDFEKAEAIRVSSENERLSAEANRKTSENQRIISENERILGEVGRISAEDLRQSSENTRLTSEQDRKNAENQRSNAEALRVTAEFNRANSESSRAAAEGVREARDLERTAFISQFMAMTPDNKKKVTADILELSEPLKGSIEHALKADKLTDDSQYIKKSDTGWKTVNANVSYRIVNGLCNLQINTQYTAWQGDIELPEEAKPSRPITEWGTMWVANIMGTTETIAIQIRAWGLLQLHFYGKSGNIWSDIMYRVD
ncbi:MAG: BppU family phage baseplate upper protein [Streptococcaceae bacterium]|nr:BppU family phage baseplate upper protein [Streptococcaceae bacterium]MCL2680906.1 BppU family phage baseplate upper protein [Streptococcaceae bacterium]MCL2858102.1 BppU family phage baseplate upper protein [Streptococcaceae bacterium]